MKCIRRSYEDEMFIAEMPTGSVLLYLGGIWHGGGRNRSNTGRMGLTLQYSAGWLRQEENQYLANPPEVAHEYPEPLQRLIGYDFGGPFLGFVNGDDPKSILDNGRPRTRGRGQRPGGRSGFGSARRGDRAGGRAENLMNTMACEGFPGLGASLCAPRIVHDSCCYRV